MEPDVRITFRFLRDPDGVAPVIRLRQLLKYAKRAQFLKALFPIQDLPTEQLIPGAEPVSIREIDEAADQYIKVRNRRMKLSLEEVELRDKLTALMQEHKLIIYEWDEQIVELTATEKVKVRKKQGAGENGESVNE